MIVESVPDRYCQISDNVCSEGFREGDGRIFELVSSHLGNCSFVFVFFLSDPGVPGVRSMGPVV